MNLWLLCRIFLCKAWKGPCDSKGACIKHSLDKIEFWNNIYSARHSFYLLQSSKSMCNPANYSENDVFALLVIERRFFYFHNFEKQEIGRGRTANHLTSFSCLKPYNEKFKRMKMKRYSSSL